MFHLCFQVYELETRAESMVYYFHWQLRRSHTYSLAPNLMSDGEYKSTQRQRNTEKGSDFGMTRSRGPGGRCRKERADGGVAGALCEGGGSEEAVLQVCGAKSCRQGESKG